MENKVKYLYENNKEKDENGVLLSYWEKKLSESKGDLDKLIAREDKLKAELDKLKAELDKLIAREDKLKITELRSKIDVMQASKMEVVSERADFGIGNSGLLIDRLAGKPVVVLATIFQHSPLVLLTRREQGGAVAESAPAACVSAARSVYVVHR